MSNSSLVNYTLISPNTYGKRTHKIDRITPHCMAIQWTEQQCLASFASRARQASCNYAIGKTGGVGLCLGEDMWAWCSSSTSNDNRAVTIECASNSYHPYAFNSKVYNKLVDLCEDICRRNGKTKLLWLGDKTKTLNYTPKSDEIVLSAHRWFKAKACPGDWMYSRFGALATEVTNRLTNFTPYKVKITEVAAVRKKPTSASKKLMVLHPGGVYTIVKTKGKWGKLKSGAGWISLKKTKKV